MKKDGTAPPALALVENPDILATHRASEARRPPLVIGFAAETENVDRSTPGPSSRARAAT